MKTKVFIFFITILLSITSCTNNSLQKNDVTPEITIETETKAENIIPYVNVNLKTVGNTFYWIRSNISNSWSWSDDYTNNAINAFDLINFEQVDCYFDINGLRAGKPPYTYLGIKNDTAVFLGISGAQYEKMVIRENINTRILAIEPTIYSIYDGAINAYVWQLNNGYLIITVRPTNGLPWYDQYIDSYIEVSDLNYISYLKDNNIK